ncbi:helix-turn-helix domain-containing protein [Mycolicibacterium conceptionense]|uniref:helix-turn-helix domain-containing protein n=1 Tax=Mycolicibacterium conceptionense TaxID=451644 RepID=UPI000B2AC3A2|nr:helix-turn-helix transcriptional regulator [Mycolicibacterium conceptionense]
MESDIVETDQKAPDYDPNEPAQPDAALGAALRARRLNAACSIEKVAELSGIDLKVLSRIERGDRPLRVTELVTLAETLHTEPETLIRAAKAIRLRREAEAILAERMVHKRPGAKSEKVDSEEQDAEP